MKNRIIVDCNNICYRAFYTTGGLSLNGDPTGVIFGFFNQLFTVANNIGPSDYIFCWDSRESKRKEIYSAYKANRIKEDLSADEIDAREMLFSQIDKLREVILPNMFGLSRVLIEEGYEADDLLAHCAESSKGAYNYIFSSDEDVYQLLEENVSVFKPGKNSIFSRDDFIKSFGIQPSSWVDVKSIAGCSSDNIPGVPGVGEKTAIKFLNSQLKTSSKKWQAIINFKNSEDYVRNLKLVALPFEKEGGWKEIDFKDSVLYRSDFYSFFREYEFKRFLNDFQNISINFNLT